AGNTGALTAIAHFVLGTPPGVERAAIISAIPAAHGHTHMLDLGANTTATPEQLRQFAAMGAIIARDVYGVANPRIGLLNIGEEDMKGHELVQAAQALLARSGLNYVGFVEGDDIFSGDVDVVVTDGFTGNVALKTMEGVAGLIADRMRQEFRASWLDRITGTGSYLPEKVITNFDLEKMVDTSDEWIRSRTGIERRHVAADGETTVDLAEQAARRALDGAGVAPADVDFIAFGTTTPDLVF